MESIKTPYLLGAGSQSPELAGRNEVWKRIRVALARVRAGRPAKSVLMIGLLEAGKTVLLDRIRDDAEASSIQTLRVEAPEIPTRLVPI